jgi:quercetin dioxygenase-like cupin family protein
VRDDVLALLQDRGAAEVPHPGGTLLAHLERVERRLREHGLDEVVCLAALAHAAYGTDGFDTALLTLDERPLLAEAAGDEVERLVHLYGCSDRSRTWTALPDARVVHDRWSGAVLTPSEQDLRRFVDLSIVNELDVVEQSVEVRTRHAGSLLSLFRSWSALASPAVSADADWVLGTTRWENPHTGETVELLSETPELLVLRAVWPRPGHRAAAHIHPGMQETWTVVSGRATVEIEGSRAEIGPGESVTAQAGQLHQASNAGRDPVVLQIEMRPGLRWPTFVRRLFTGPPSPHLLEEFAEEIRLPS